MEATIANKLKVAVVGIALAASGFVLGATGAAWAQNDGSTGGMEACQNGAMSHEAGDGMAGMKM